MILQNFAETRFLQNFAEVMWDLWPWARLGGDDLGDTSNNWKGDLRGFAGILVLFGSV